LCFFPYHFCAFFRRSLCDLTIVKTTEALLKTHSIADAEANLLAGSPASASGPPLAGAVVLSFRFPSPTAAALDGWESEASSLDEDVFQIGELAVRISGNFSLPRLLVVRQDQSQGAL
jgi:hypothetical protein